MGLRVLLVDDEELPRGILCSELEAVGFQVSEAADGLEGLRRFDEIQPDIVVTDKNMTGRDGLDLLADIRDRSAVPVIVLTAYGTVTSAVSAMKMGATEFVPSDEIEMAELVQLIHKTALASGHNQRGPTFREVFPGSSKLADRLRKRISVFAPLETPVLLQGARGTNKHRLVQAMHANGSSSHSRLLELDARDFQQDLLTSEIGAVHLTSIESLTNEAQPYWAEMLSQFNTSFSADRIRLFASTELAAGCSGLLPKLAGALSGFVVEIPLLTDHIEDLEDIATAALTQIGQDLDRTGLNLTEDALHRLQNRKWPGNELEFLNVLMRAAVLSPGRLLGIEAVEQALDEILASVARIRKLERSRERETLLLALQQAGGRISHASQILQTSRSAVYRLMDKHGFPRERRG